MYVHGKPKEPQAPVKKFELPFNFKRGEKKENPVKRFKLPFNFKRGEKKENPVKTFEMPSDVKRGEKKEKSKRVGVRRPLKHKIPRAVRKNRAERMANQSYFDGSVLGLLVLILRSGITIVCAMLLSGAIHYVWIAKGVGIESITMESLSHYLARGSGGPSTLVVMLVNAIIMSYASCYVMCFNIRWVCSHRVIAGRRQNFIGTTSNLFGHTIRWLLGWVGLGAATSLVGRIPVPMVMFIPLFIMVWYALFVTLSFIKWVTSNISA